MQKDSIDHGQPFDWGRASDDYARFRDVYPPAFYQKITELGLCIAGQNVLDLGTGTGVLPRHLYGGGAHFVGVDASENQIAAARRLSEGMDIAYVVSPAEELDFPPASFDVVTACQCAFYFDHARLLPVLARILKPGGRYAQLYMEWLPAESDIVAQSESLILQFNPAWSGANETRHPIEAPPEAAGLFETVDTLVFDVAVPFTRESWHGRMRSCRGIGAALPPEEIAAFDAAHMALLKRIAPEQFIVPHYAAILTMRPV